MISGFGTDTVGEYVYFGTYYHGTGRISMEKRYKLGTGDPQQNLGHTVDLRMEWNGEKQAFEGTFHVATDKWIGSGGWEMQPS